MSPLWSYERKRAFEVKAKTWLRAGREWEGQAMCGWLDGASQSHLYCRHAVPIVGVYTSGINSLTCALAEQSGKYQSDLFRLHISSFTRRPPTLSMRVL